MVEVCRQEKAAVMICGVLLLFLPALLAAGHTRQRVSVRVRPLATACFRCTR